MTVPTALLEFAAAAREGSGALLSTLDERLQLLAVDAPTSLAIDPKPLDIAGSQVSADCFNAEFQLGGYLFDGQQFGGHHHDVTNYSTILDSMSCHVV